MLSQWQLLVLDVAPWFLVPMSLVAMLTFPWAHWNSLIGED